MDNAADALALRRLRSKDRSARIRSLLGIEVGMPTEQTALGVSEIGNDRESKEWLRG